MSNKKYFTYRQNNSGGSFDRPAVNVIVEADTQAKADELVSQHLTLCGTSGRYADYDDCGCCPCCGHRWDGLWTDEPETGAEALHGNVQLKYMGATCVALVRADGTITVGDTQEKLDAIVAELTP